MDEPTADVITLRRELAEARALVERAEAALASCLRSTAAEVNRNGRIDVLRRDLNFYLRRHS